MWLFFWVTLRCQTTYIYIYINKSSILAQKRFILFIEPSLCSHQKHSLLLLLLFICIVCYLRKHTPFCFILFCFVHKIKAYSSVGACGHPFSRPQTFFNNS